MRSLIQLLLLTALLLLVSPLTGRAQTSCDTALAEGGRAYEDARFDEALRRIEGCVARFNTPDKARAYRLIALIHLGDGNESAARQAVRNLLRADPAYAPDPNLDPPPFVALVAAERSPAPAAVGTVAPAGAVEDEKSNTRGFFGQLGVGYAALTLSADGSSDTDNGGSASLLLGYGFTPNLTAFALIDAGSFQPDGGDSYTHAETGAGVRYYFGTPAAALRPYLQAGIAYQMARIEGLTNDLGQSVKVDYTGAAGRLGGGVLYFFSPTLAIHGELSGAFGQFTDAEVRSGSTKLSGELDSAISTTRLRVGVGITFYPFR